MSRPTGRIGLVDLQAAFDRADGDLRRAERQLDGLVKRIETLRAERLGLELAMARNGLTPGAAPSRTGAMDPAAMSRTDAILQVMEEHAEAPLSPTEVLDLLNRLGRTKDTRHSVGAALSYLRSQGKVQQQGRGQWVVAAPPLRATSSPISIPPADDDAPVPDEPPEPEDFLYEDDCEDLE